MMNFAAEMKRKSSHGSNRPRICVSIQGNKPKEIIRKLEEVLSSDPNFLCEIRLDSLSLNFNSLLIFIREIPEHWQNRIILTLRRKESPDSNGKCEWPLEEWLVWWSRAQKVGDWFAFDLDWLGDKVLYPKLKQKVILSYHATVEKIARARKEICKTAKKNKFGIKVAANISGVIELAEFVRLRNSVCKENASITTAVFVAMGDAGRAWRWSKLSGDWSYFSYSSDEETAAGQSSWLEFLPYRNQKKWPQLYVLIGRDPKNKYGEKKWNHLFIQRNWNARYIALAFSETINEAEKQQWVKANLFWMKHASVYGASVTQPYKQYFDKEIKEKNKAINTVCNQILDNKITANYWNTDGPAVLKILQKNNLLVSDKKILIVGGGGAAHAIAQTLQKNKIPFQIWRRDPSNRLNEEELGDKKIIGIISTWPAEHQSKLVKYLEIASFQGIKFCLDAQFYLKGDQSPLNIFCKERKILYIPGTEWWVEQAQLQDTIWFGEQRKKYLLQKISPYLPYSKSETIRALAIAFAFKKNCLLFHPSNCDDSIYFREAIKEFGFTIKEDKNLWVVKAPIQYRIPKSPLYLGESATAFRFLAMLVAHMPQGSALFHCAPSLQIRKHSDLWDTLKVSWNEKWPVPITHRESLAEKIYLRETSQVASVALIVAAAKSFHQQKLLNLELIGKEKSQSYIDLTKLMLERIGFKIQNFKNKATVSFDPDSESANFLLENKDLEILISPDASGLAFVEILFQYAGIGSYLSTFHRKDGDFIFLDYLKQLKLQDELNISLADNPDLAPPLWAAAILWQKRLCIHSTPHLHNKECDRIDVLVTLAQKLGLKAIPNKDGFIIDATAAFKKIPEASSSLFDEANDHRIAMALGVLRIRWPDLKIKNPNCVNKSFPEFWNCFQIVKDWTL